MNAREIKKESSPMRFFRRIGLDSIAWSLRRLYCPVKRGGLVLDVGSGGNPYYRANILCDACLETQERFFEKLIMDRPIVLAIAENLPFKDDVFDFVIASHVLEHSKDPEKFISELQRVAKAGYIEVPDAFMERLTNYPFHCLEITDLNDGLLIRKKNGPIQDMELFELFKNKARGMARRWFEINPFNFHVRYYWSRESGGVRYTIVNPEYKFDWEFTQIPSTAAQQRMSVKTMFNKVALFLFRALFSQNRRNREIKLEKYLKCLECGGDVVARQGEYTCVKCGRSYSIIRGQIPDFRR